jgi:hypothetical protein
VGTVVVQAVRPAVRGGPKGPHYYCLLATLVCLTVVAAPSFAQLPLEPLKDSGQGVTPAYEGWFKNADGSFTLLLGYFNRNLKQTLDIPIGPDNQIEPGGPDRGQPTHFLPRRQWGIFTVRVPADFGDRKLTWTIAANGKRASVPVGLHRDYEIEPFKDAANKNTPPVLRFELGGSPLQGPPRGIVATLGTTLPEPVTLTLYASDDGIVTPDRRAGASPVSVTWSLLRGPGEVVFGDPKPAVDKTNGKTTTTATFSMPGEYILRAQANDVSGDGGGGFQCCWTNAHVKVVVKGR